MSAPPVPLSYPHIVTTLRAAGCVFAEDEARLLLDAVTEPADLARMVKRRAGGLPLEHVLGWVEFCGRRIAVDPGVFVPRRRTEFLVREAVAVTRHGAVVLDLCCGCGAIGAALSAAVGRIKLFAVEIDSAALPSARRNLAPVGGRVYQGDLYEPLPATLRGQVDVVVANVPYVPTGALGLLPPEAREHEASVALDGGADGLTVLRRVADDAIGWLVPGGHLLIEISAGQVSAAMAAFASAGLLPRVASSEEYEATVAIGARPTG